MTIYLLSDLRVETVEKVAEFGLIIEAANHSLFCFAYFVKLHHIFYTTTEESHPSPYLSIFSSLLFPHSLA